MPSFLTALPVYNEARYIHGVLDQVLQYSPEVLVVDDGSSDGTAAILDSRSDIQRVTHAKNQGYGAALRSAFDYTLEHGYDFLVTIDCDGQHQPQRIPQFIEAAVDADIVSGSRYLERFAGDSEPPADRRRINQQITQLVNGRLGLELTDAFCGFKAYSCRALSHFHITETGYAMPLEVWAQAVKSKLTITELAVPLIYLDLSRSFGGSLDDSAIRLRHYQDVLDRAIAAPLAPPRRNTLCGERAK